MSHAIPRHVCQTLKSHRWNCNVLGCCTKFGYPNCVRVLVDEAPEASSCVRSSSHDTVHDPRDASNTTPTPQNAKSRLTRIFSGSRASDTRGQASLPPRRRTPRPQPPVVSVFRRGGRRCGRLPTANRNLTAPNGNLTASKRGNCTIRGARTSSPHVESATKRENCTTRGSRSGLPADDTASKRGELHH